MDLSSDKPLDVLIVGAGLAGIAAARDLRRLAPHLRVRIVEARERLGGTWDLFRYPGVRSDSDFQTLGFADKPVNNGRITAEGADILAYIEDAARERGIDRDILFRHRVVAADFSSAAGLWRVDLETGADKTPLRLGARFIYWCGGYYDYASGHMPDFPGAADFAGPILHPQFWPENFDATGKRIIVIGSGATAVSLVPALAQKARHVVMLQRSPSYIVAAPGDDAMARAMARFLPARLTFALTRWRNILLGQALYRLARRKPDWAKRRLLAPIQQRLKLDDEAMKIFTPRYNVWDQRVCLDPDGALLDCLLKGGASLVTGEIEKITADGLRLRDGESFRADVLVAATGLNIQVFGGARLSVDGAPVESGALTAYKGCMFSGLPNFVAGLGYANASWTLKCQLTTRYLLRLLRAMAAKKARWAAPEGPPAAAGPVLALSANYILRADAILPRQGAEPPWRYNVTDLRDVWTLRFGRVDDGALRFG